MSQENETREQEKTLSTFIKLENQYELLDLKNCNELVVFAAINSFCKSYGYYNGGYSYLSKHFPMSRNTVIRTIKALVDKNYILETPGKYDKANKYKINVELIASIINRYTQNGYTQIEYTQNGQEVYPNWVDGIPKMGTSKNIVRIDSKNNNIYAQKVAQEVAPKQGNQNTPEEEQEQHSQPKDSEQGKDPARSQKKRDTAMYQQQFEKFWQEYPKKRGKRQAHKAWLKLKPNEELFKQIMQAVQTWKDSSDWQKEDGQFIPYPATWLNGERWNDEAPAPPKGQQAEQTPGISSEARKPHYQTPKLDPEIFGADYVSTNSLKNS